MTDFVFMVEDTSYMFITGPDVVKTVTGEDVTQQELGGAMSHASKSGVCQFTAADDKACLDDVRYLMSFLPANNLEEPPAFTATDDPERPKLLVIGAVAPGSSIGALDGELDIALSDVAMALLQRVRGSKRKHPHLAPPRVRDGPQQPASLFPHDCAPTPCCYAGWVDRPKSNAVRCNWLLGQTTARAPRSPPEGSRR